MIFAIHGFKQSGKDTLADFMVGEFGFRKLAFADKLKETLHALFNVPREKLWGSEADKQSLTSVRWEHLQDLPPREHQHETFLTIRELLQIFATEVCRQKIPGIWYQYLDLPMRQRLVISDLRFANEAEFLRQRGAHVIEVRRPGVLGGAHASEAGLPADLVDHVLVNDGTLADLHDKARVLLASLKV